MTSEAPGHAGLTEADFVYLERLAATAADSGLYGSGNKIKAQLLMKLIYGRDLQIPVSAALSAIDIYDGKMELSSNLIAALLEAHPHYAYAIVETTNERCEIEFFKDGNSRPRRHRVLPPVPQRHVLRPRHDARGAPVLPGTRQGRRDLRDR
jgi:hypothetical protein